MNLVSVIIPSYNSGKFLNEAIKSVASQTYRDLEIIIINDGSIDDTEKIAKDWQKKDKRIRYLKHHKNQGLASARNTGIRNSKGEYIAFLDADDVWLPQKLAVQIKKIRESGADLVFSNWYIWEHGKRTKVEAFDSNPIQDNKKNLLNFLIKKNFGNPSTAFFLKSSLEKVGLFDESLRSSEDYDLWLRFLLSKMKIGFIKKPLIYYRQHSEQMSVNIYKMRVSRLQIFKKIVRKNPLFLFKYPILTKKIFLLQGYKFIQDFLRILRLKNKI